MTRQLCLRPKHTLLQVHSAPHPPNPCGAPALELIAATTSEVLLEKHVLYCLLTTNCNAHFSNDSIQLRDLNWQSVHTNSRNGARCTMRTSCLHHRRRRSSVFFSFQTSRWPTHAALHMLIHTAFLCDCQWC